MKITKIKKAKKRKNRIHIYIDNEYIFSCNLDFIIENNLYKDKEIDKKILDNLFDKLYFANSRDYVLNIFSRKNYTEFEIINKLKKRNVPETIINNIVKYLKEKEILNDMNFLKDYIDYLKKQNKYSLMEIKKKVFNKHFNIDEEKIKSCLNDYNEEYTIEKILKKKKLNRDNKNRIVNYLLRKGFSYEGVKKKINITNEEEL